MREKDEAIKEGQREAAKYIEKLKTFRPNNEEFITALTAMKQYAATLRSDNRQSCFEEYTKDMPQRLSKTSESFRLYIGGKLEELPHECHAGFLVAVCDVLAKTINTQKQGQGI